MLNLANLRSSQFFDPNCQIRAMELERQMTSLVSSEELDLALMNPDSILRYMVIHSVLWGGGISKLSFRENQ